MAEKVNTSVKKLSKELFVVKGIQTLRKEGYKGIHTVYSGFNEAFKNYFNGDDPVQATNGLAEEGKIAIRPARGGVMLYMPEDAPSSQAAASDALAKMGL